MRRTFAPAFLWALLASVLATLALSTEPARAEPPALHFLWELHGKRNTVFLLGSIHTLRAADYPLAPVVLEAYRRAGSLVMEIDLAEVDSGALGAEMLAGATLPSGTSLHGILGPARYARAQQLARALDLDLSLFEGYAPWFVAESISQLQLMQQGFDPSSGVEMYFKGRAQADGKRIAGLETAHEQLALFTSMPMPAQADYLMGSLEQAHDLPQEIDGLVSAWQHGDTRWFEKEIESDFGSDPVLYRTLLVDRNRRWIARIERLLDDDQNHLVIVGTAHLVGRDGLIQLLAKDGIGAVQR